MFERRDVCWVYRIWSHPCFLEEIPARFKHTQGVRMLYLCLLCSLRINMRFHQVCLKYVLALLMMSKCAVIANDNSAFIQFTSIQDCVKSNTKIIHISGANQRHTFIQVACVCIKFRTRQMLMNLEQLQWSCGVDDACVV